MGRTIIPARWQLEEIEELKKFKLALRKDDLAYFEKLMLYPKLHISAISYCANLNLMESIFLSILLEQEKRLAKIEKLLRKK